MNAAPPPMPHVLDDYDELRPCFAAVRDVLAGLRPGVSGSAGRAGTLADYGCGPGSWALIGAGLYESVIGIDVLAHRVARGRELAALNGLANVKFLNLLAEPDAAIPPLDAMTAINVMPVIRSDHAHAMFAFAARHLVPGGRFLISAYRAPVFFDQLLSLEYFAYVSPGRALWRYAATARSALETLYGPRIRNVPRARAYHAPNGMVALGAEYGLRLAQGPDHFARLEAFGQIDRLFAGQAYRRRVRWADWFLFEKSKDSAA